jgi:hypothetical protein
LVEISSRPEISFYYKRNGMERRLVKRSGLLLAQKRKFFLNPRRRNEAPTVSNTPPTGSNPIGVNDSTRNVTTPMLENIALRQM